MSKKKHKQNQSLVSDETKNKVVSDSQQNATQPDATNPQEHGRSMVEILGVLAVLGVLSIGGIQGYTYAMNKYHSNEVVNELNLLNAQLAIFMSGIHEDEAVMSLGEPYDDGETINAGGYAFAYGCGQDPESVTPCDLDETGYYMTLNGVPEDICKSASQMTANMMNLVEQRINGHTDNDGILCQDGDNQLIFLFDANQNPILNNVETTQPSEDITTTEYYEETTLIENTTTTATPWYTGTTTTPWYTGTTTTPWYTGTGTTPWHTETYTGTGTYTYNPDCSKRGVFCKGNNSVFSSEAQTFCENLGYRLATKDELSYSDYPYTYDYAWVNDNGTIKSAYKQSDGSAYSYILSATAQPALCIEIGAVIERPADECQTHVDCAEKYNNNNKYACITRDDTVKECKQATCSGELYCRGNLSIASGDAASFCAVFDKRLLTKEEYLYIDYQSYSYSWINDNGTVKYSFKWSDGSLHVSTPYSSDKYPSFCIDKDSVIEKPADECQTHTDCAEKHGSNQYFCIESTKTSKVCKKGSCSGDFCLSGSSGIYFAYSGNPESFCSAFGKRLATLEEWTYVSTYSGSPVWIKNNGTVESWYKCCENYSTPYKRSYSETTTQSALCIDPNYNVQASGCQTTSDCKSSGYICMTYPNNKKTCEYMGCSGNNQICYVYDSVMSINAKDACQVNGKRIITKSEYENLAGSSYTGNYWVDNGGRIERWYKSGSNFYQQNTSTTTTSYTLCVATNFSVDKYNQGITTSYTTTYPRTTTTTNTYTGTRTTTTTRPATTTTTRPYTGTRTTTTTRPATTTTTPPYTGTRTTTTTRPATTTTTTTRPATTTTTTTRPATTTTTTPYVYETTR